MSSIARNCSLAALVVLCSAACTDPADASPPADGGGLPNDAGFAPDPAGAAADGGGAPPADGGARAAQPFSIVILPDTQFYVESYPQIFQAQTRWVVSQRQARRIAFVLHEGDIVQTPDHRPDWARANAALALLDGVVPYVLAAGNHDIDVTTREAALFNATFPRTRFGAAVRGTFEPDKLQNAHYFVSGGGRTWLVLTLEFGPRDEAVAWAKGILDASPEKPAILVTHAYMYLGDQRYDHSRHSPDTEQYWSPYSSAYPLPGSRNDGQEMWDKLVSKHENLLFVFSGHSTHPDGAVGRLSTRRPSGRWVHEMLANYQGCPVDDMCLQSDQTPVMGGRGFLRIVTVDEAQARATVETYSPFLDQYRHDPGNEFELPL